MDQEKPKIEVATDPEYADLIINDVMLHGNEQRNPKEWYPELLYNSELSQGGRIYANKENVAVYPIEGVGMIIEQRFPVSPETANLYSQAHTSGSIFRLYVPKSGIQIIYHESLKERIRAHNKKMGFARFDTEDGHGQLYTFDIVDGTAILKVVIK